LYSKKPNDWNFIKANFLGKSAADVKARYYELKEIEKLVLKSKSETSQGSTGVSPLSGDNEAIKKSPGLEF
jgi:hypothetical protein